MDLNLAEGTHATEAKILANGADRAPANLRTESFKLPACFLRQAYARGSEVASGEKFSIEESFYGYCYCYFSNQHHLGQLSPLSLLSLITLHCTKLASLEKIPIHLLSQEVQSESTRSMLISHGFVISALPI